MFFRLPTLLSDPLSADETRWRSFRLGTSADIATEACDHPSCFKNDEFALSRVKTRQDNPHRGLTTTPLALKQIDLLSLGEIIAKRGSLSVENSANDLSAICREIFVLQQKKLLPNVPKD